jgi:dTMP kinase
MTPQSLSPPPRTPQDDNGILIVFDGIDGGGKTTQAKLLADILTAAGETVTLSKEPTDGPWGKQLRASATTGRMSLADELHAFTEDRKQHVAALIAPALARGEIVILDRYFYSTIAYQGARGGDVAAIEAEQRAIAAQPDVAFIPDLDVSTALTRISHSRGEIPNEFEQFDSLSKVRQIFLDLAQVNSEMCLVDGGRTIGEIYAVIGKVLLNGALKTKRSIKQYTADSLFYREAHFSNRQNAVAFFRQLVAQRS